MPGGFGIFFYDDNATYCGETVRGDPHGYGILCARDGSRFLGRWSEGRREGTGLLHLSSGKLFLVAYSEGKEVSCDAVSLLATDGTIPYDCDLDLWSLTQEERTTVLQAEAASFFATLSAEVAKGGGQPSGFEHGSRVRRWAQAGGSSYTGQVVDGVPFGYGVQVWPDGNRYAGQWVAGRRHGVGVFTFSSGSVSRLFAVDLVCLTH